MRNLHYLLLRTITIALLILTVANGMAHSAPYDDPPLPILADHGMYTIEVCPQRHQLVVWAYGQRFKTYPVAVGNPSTPTPVGEYQVIYKG